MLFVILLQCLSIYSRGNNASVARQLNNRRIARHEDNEDEKTREIGVLLSERESIYRTS